MRESYREEQRRRNGLAAAVRTLHQQLADLDRPFPDAPAAAARCDHTDLPPAMCHHCKEITMRETAQGRIPQQRILAEIAAERGRQDEKFGEQNHVDGTGQYPETVDADVARMACQSAAEGGYLDWLHILREEVAEAFAEADPAKLRAELVQVAAVAVAWIQAIDRRGPFLGAEVTETPHGFVWRCNGGQGCDGWIGTGVASRSGAWDEYQRHVADEHTAAALDPLAGAAAEARLAGDEPIPDELTEPEVDCG